MLEKDDASRGGGGGPGRVSNAAVGNLSSSLESRLSLLVRPTPDTRGSL
jgi:hypothetical protein